MSEEIKAPFGQAPVKVKPETGNARPASPQPSTSTSSASSASTSSSSRRRRPSVYSHIEGIEDIQHLRSFRPGRRRSLYRLIGKAKLARQYEQAIRILGPIFAEETRRQEEAATLIAAAIEHFAITVNNIADQLEGKTPVNEYAAKIDKLKRRQQHEFAKRKAEHPEEFEEKEPVEKLDEKEQAKRLHEEIVAAITAITTGDKKGERFPNLFTVDLAKDLRTQAAQNRPEKPEDKDVAPDDKIA